jgi:hypothetical protein
VVLVRAQVSSSLLIIYDDASPPRAPPGVWMIDFAHVHAVDPTIGKVTHREPWQKGNREEGYLLGLDSLLTTFESLPAGIAREATRQATRRAAAEATQQQAQQ